MANASLSGRLRNWQRPGALPPGRLWRFTSPPVLLSVVAILGIQLIGTHFAAENQSERRDLDALAYGLLGAGPLALALRHRFPVPVLWFVMGISLAYLLREYPYGPFILSVVVALFTAVLENHRRAAWAAAAALYGGHFGSMYALDLHSPSWGQYVGVGAWLLVVLAVSEVVRARRDWAMGAAQTRQEESQRRRSDERLRIARELHDVLAHNISLINVQSGVALHLMDREPQQARTALTAIEAASREALTELRSVLDILRRPEEDLPRSPAPGLDRLESLLDSARAAGLEVEALVSGEIPSLPAPVDAAAFRVIQEALTNVIRHAHARRVTVRVGCSVRALELEVLDDGTGPGRPQRLPMGGSGIAGMRERVIALGGEFAAAAAPSGGFRVWARLPLEPDP